MSEQTMQIKHHDGIDWTKMMPKTTIGQVTGLGSQLSQLEAIAKGASRAKAFADVDALNAWLNVAANREGLQVGDNFYTIKKGDPDFWWTGDGIQPLETEKVILAMASATENGLMSKEDFTKLSTIAENANNYTHPTGDGNQHVPATGTTSKDKILQAGATEGSESWKTLDEAGIAKKEHTHDKADLNIITVHVGSVAPTDPSNGDIWFDYNN